MGCMSVSPEKATPRPMAPPLRLSGLPQGPPSALAFQLKEALGLEQTPALRLLGGGAALCFAANPADRAKVSASGSAALELLGVAVAVSAAVAAPAVETAEACDGRRVSVQIVSDTM